MNVKNNSFFSNELLSWYENNDRELPWKNEKDPYLIWLSEIILQQTRVDQGLSYYIKFKSAFPTIFDLANVSEDEVFHLWQGLGYYSRARNLHFTAKTIVEKYNGIFPNTYKEIIQLKGIGPYTAAAIASFAFNLPHAVVDGNVYRVLSRFFDIHVAIDSTQGKKDFQQLAQDLLDKNNPGIYNQAIMDFGATHCTPQSPNCLNCPLNNHCQAFLSNTVSERPVKYKKLKHKTRYFNYLVIEDGRSTIITKRTQKDIWQDLFEYPMIETDSIAEDFTKEIHPYLNEVLSDKWVFKSASPIYKQTLSHQKITARFWEIRVDQISNNSAYLKIDKEKLTNFAFPKIIHCYFEDNSLYLKV